MKIFCWVAAYIGIVAIILKVLKGRFS